MPDPLVITASAWAWDKYGKSLTDKAVSAFKDGWTKSRWQKASDAYRAKIKKLYGTMQIMGMAEPVPLDNIFTEAYLLNKPTAFSRFDIERLKQVSADPDAPPPNAKRVTGLSLVKKNKNLFILGKPGAGKTTFLRYIAVQAAEPSKPVIDKVPILIPLKRWADSGMELMPFIEEQFDKCDFHDARPFVEELLKSGGAIALFDGLDEVSHEGGQRDRQTLAMNNFIEKYDRTQCLITCRLAANEYSFKPFTYVEIADFTPKQIETFVGNWFRNDEGEKDEETSKRFLAEFKREDNKGLRDLARTPLLLTLLCLSFKETLTFPQRRVEIYKEALDALLKKWDSSRKIKRDEVYRKLSLGHKENMLSRIAAETFEKNQYFIPQPELERLITDYVKNVPPHDTNEATDGGTILKAIESQHGIFVERAREVYSFSHLTFQEYFTAKYITDNAAKGTLTNLVNTHCADRRWREVLLLTSSLLPDAGPFIKSFRNAIDSLLGDDDVLIALLKWADNRSPLAQIELWIARQVSIFVEIYYRAGSGKLNVSLNNLLFHSTEIDDAFDFNKSTERVHPLALDLLLAVIRTLATDHKHLSARSIDSDHSRIPSIDLDATVELAHNLGLYELEKDLTTFTLPAEKSTAGEWQIFIEKWKSLMIKHRDIGHEWNFTELQTDRLADYIAANLMFQDCLELAFMPPEEKEAMMNSLYLPPGESGGV